MRDVLGEPVDVELTESAPRRVVEAALDANVATPEETLRKDEGQIPIEPRTRDERDQVDAGLSAYSTGWQDRKCEKIVSAHQPWGLGSALTTERVR